MRFSKSLIALALSTTLAACGGSDSSDDNVSNPPPGDDNSGSSTTVYTEGVITGFGSVYVNGQRYRSENANIALSNNPAATEGDLKVGMVVSLAASSSNNGDDPEATDIRYEEHLQGPVSFIDREAGIIEVLGQQVVFNDLTEFDETDADTLAVGDIIEVSGYIDENGDFYATRIELENDETEMKLKGTVSALDTTAQTFMLNELTIDYSSAEFDDMTADDLEDGLYVKVEGEAFDAETQTLIATEIENKDREFDDIDDADEVKIAGIVSGYDETAGTFEVNRYTFTVTDDTEFEDGPASRLTNGVRVKVEAEYDGEQLNAKEVEFIAKEARQKTEGQVTAVDADAQTFVVNDITFVVDEDTSYLDISGQGARQFNFDGIAVNDWLKVLAVVNDDGDYLALKIKRAEEDDREGEIKGIASDVTVDGMTVAGISVAFADNTEFEGDDEELTVEEFVALFSAETEIEVEVEGDYDGDVLVAREVEIEADDEDDEDEDDDGDDDDDNGADKRGKAEFEGSVESIDGDSVIVNGHELRFTSNSELEIDGESATLEEFFEALEVGSIIEIEGVWREQTYIEVQEAEL